MASGQKKYGLIIQKKRSAVQAPLKRTAAVSSMFGDDSDEEDPAKAKAAVNESVRREAAKKQQTKQTRLDMQKALSEDPSIYDYDAVYDDLQEKRKAVQEAKQDRGKEPKYIKNLLKTAEQRKRDYERMTERKAQREREMEGGMYDDKEAFVTESFRRKMQDLAEDEEKEKRQAELEAANDVMKQKDLSGFYRNLLARNMSKASYNVQAVGKESGEAAERRKSSETRPVEESKEENGDIRRKETQGETDRQDESKERKMSQKDGEDEETRSSDESEDEDQKERIEEPFEAVERVVDELEEETPSKRVQEEKGEGTNLSKIDRRNTESSVAAARERYLARKLAATRQSQSKDSG